MDKAKVIELIAKHIETTFNIKGHLNPWKLRLTDTLESNITPEATFDLSYENDVIGECLASIHWYHSLEPTYKEVSEKQPCEFEYEFDLFQPQLASFSDLASLSRFSIYAFPRRDRAAFTATMVEFLWENRTSLKLRALEYIPRDWLVENSLASMEYINDPE